MLSVNFYKNEKMFEIDLNSDLKREPDLNSRYCFTLLWTDRNPNVGKYASICMCNFVNMPEYTWNITWLNKLGL